MMAKLKTKKIIKLKDLKKDLLINPDENDKTNVELPEKEVRKNENSETEIPF